MNSDFKKLDHTLLLFLVALFLLNSPFSNWWMRLQLPWYIIFVVWVCIIALVALNQIRSDSSHGD